MTVTAASTERGPRTRAAVSDTAGMNMSETLLEAKGAVGYPDATEGKGGNKDDASYIL